MKKLASFVFIAVYPLLLSAMYQESQESQESNIFAPYYDQEQQSYKLLCSSQNNNIIYEQPMNFSSPNLHYNTPVQSNYLVYSQYQQPSTINTQQPIFISPTLSYNTSGQQYEQPTIINNPQPVYYSRTSITNSQTIIPREVYDYSKISAEIYKNARKFVESYKGKPAVSGIPFDIRLTRLISQIYDAKQKGLSENILWNIKIEDSPRTTLFYHSLRNYFFTTSYTNESIISLEKVGKLNFSMLTEFPAYLMLADSLLSIVKQNDQDLAIVAPYLSLDNKTISDLVEATSPYDDDSDLVAEFYTMASDLLLGNDKSPIAEQVYEIVRIVEEAKISNLIDHPGVLSREIEEFEPDEPINTLKSWFDEKYSTQNIKNRIKILVDFISQYESAKLDKLTPTIKLRILREVIKNIRVPMLENLSELLNKSNAFDDFDRLIEQVEFLISLMIRPFLTCSEK